LNSVVSFIVRIIKEKDSLTTRIDEPQPLDII